MKKCCARRKCHKRCIVIHKKIVKVTKRFKVVKPVKVIRITKVIEREIIIREGGLCPCGNQVANSSFENATLAPWVATGTVTLATGQGAHTGVQGVQLDANEAITQSNVPVTAGCCYELMFWAKGPSGTPNTLTATVTFAGATGPDLTISITGGTMDPNSWTSYRGFTSCVPSGVTTATIRFLSGGNNEFIDDVILASAGSCPQTPSNET